MKTVTFVATAAIMLISCSGSIKKESKNYNKTLELKVYDKAVKGYLSDIIEVIDSDYKFEYKGTQSTGEGKIQVKLKSISKGDVNDYGLNDGDSGPLYLSLCDANGAPLNSFDNIKNEYTGDAALKTLLSKTGEEAWVSFQLYTYGGIELPDEAKTFYISSSPKQGKIEVSTESSGGNFDKMLDDYEAYVESYLKFLKKANAGDISAITEYPVMYEKALSLEKSLAKAQGDKSLSSKQINRMVKIQAKMLNAVNEMHK